MLKFCFGGNFVCETKLEDLVMSDFFRYYDPEDACFEFRKKPLAEKYEILDALMEIFRKDMAEDWFSKDMYIKYGNYSEIVRIKTITAQHAELNNIYKDICCEFAKNYNLKLFWGFAYYYVCLAAVLKICIMMK